MAASITAVYLGMRDLMVESGGTCASGGPYEIANHCSSGQVALLAGGAVAMLMFAGLLAAVEQWVDGPRIGWPAIVGALFLALGWNFIDLGLDPPREDGTSVGWLVSGGGLLAHGGGLFRARRYEGRRLAASRRRAGAGALHSCTPGPRLRPARVCSRPRRRPWPTCQHGSSCRPAGPTTSVPPDDPHPDVRVPGRNRAGRSGRSGAGQTRG